MPGRKKKQFIDKKTAATFHLVHRSQRDPLQADEDAPQRVLLPVEQITDHDKYEARREEQRKFGVFYDDDYDYMQHLRDLNELSDVMPLETQWAPDKHRSDGDIQQNAKLQLPSEVFATNEETEVGLLNKAVAVRGPQPDWDPDIVAALDEDFDLEDPDNQLEDDFMVQAMASAHTSAEGHGPLHRVRFKDDDADIASDEAEMSDAGSDFGSFDEEHDFTEEETRSRFTQYSMTSSVMRRNEGLTLLDDRFEKLYEEYGDEEIGALEQEEITGYLGEKSEVLNSALEEFEKQEKRRQIKLKDVVQPADDVKEDEEESDSETELVKMVVEEPKEKWDCESILSTYSTIYNHPTLIKEESKKNKPIKLTVRAGIPDDVLPHRGLTRKQLEESQNQMSNIDRVPTYRPKDETITEKKERKKSIKEERKARREEKKANTMAFKTEKAQQLREVMNVQKSLQGIKMC